MSTIDNNGNLVLSDDDMGKDPMIAASEAVGDANPFDAFNTIAGDGPSFTDPLLAQVPTTDANPFDKEAMAPHAKAMISALETAISQPEKFDYLVIVLGKDGRKPYVHGTAPNALASVALTLTATPEERLVADMDVNFFYGGDAYRFFHEELKRRALTDLNGDGVIDQKDDDIRLQTLADDGCPHVND